jgi:TatD DNase family protein
MNLEKIIQKCFDDGFAPNVCKGQLFGGITTCRRELAKRKFYAIGEIGIDLYWDKTHLPRATNRFQKTNSISKAIQIPIVIHCREAFDEIFEI